MIRVLPATLLLSTLAIAQTDKPLKFEVCDIQVSKIEDPRQMSANFLPGGRVDVRGMPMKTVLSAVFQMSDDRISGPSWLSSERYDIICKADPKSTDLQLFEMARNMLADRFKMAYHTEKKSMSVYALEAGKKGPSLTASTDTKEPGCQQARISNEPGGPTLIHRICHALTMDGLATWLPQIAPAYFDMPVVNASEIKGAYDFQLEWMGRAAYNAAVTANNGATPSDAISIFDAVEKIGLKLEKRKQDVDAIVIDSILRVPTSEN